MKTNIEIKEGKWVLIYERYIDDLGLERDSFDLFDSEKRIHYPFLGDIKVANFSKNLLIGKIPYKYTKKDLIKMLRDKLK